MKTIIDGISVNYIDKGKGNVILLLHGWGVNIGYYTDIISSLEKKHRILALDLPGFGESDALTKAWNAEDYAKFVIRFVQSLNITKLSLIGHSHGGRTIIKLTSQMDLPFEINKIVLIASAGIVAKKSLRQKLKLRIYKIGRTILSIGFVSKAFPNALENYRKKHGSADYNNASPVMRATLVQLVNEDLRDLLPNIKNPTLLIWGDKDTETPIENAKLMEKMIPDAGLVTIEDGTHYAYLEQPYLVEKVLDSFL